MLRGMRRALGDKVLGGLMIGAVVLSVKGLTMVYHGIAMVLGW